MIEPEHSPDVVWQPALVGREARWQALGHRGATVWLTGLPCSGKTTVASAVERRLVEDGVPAYRLDGDNLRHGLSANLGFSPEDRHENVRRAAQAALLLADAGVIAIVALISPYEADRAVARDIHAREGIDFFEVFVNTPPEECEARDNKGLYARARSGELTGLTGVDAPYETPTAPDLELAGLDVVQAADAVVGLLRREPATPAP